MPTPPHLDYPIVAVGDLHGQRDELIRLVDRIQARPTWRDAAIVFLGDLVDRGPDPKGVIELVMELLARPAGGSAVRGNHDHALVRAARLDGGPHSAYWTPRYQKNYEHEQTFRSYGVDAEALRGSWEDDLEALRAAVPDTHRQFLADLPWVVEAEGHLFLHGGLSPELGASAKEQVEALHARRWERDALRPKPDTPTDLLWTPEYPVWLGADRFLSADPLPHPTKVQVTGHVRVPEPEANPVRIRMDTSGGYGSPSACLLRSPSAAPEFLRGA